MAAVVEAQMGLAMEEFMQKMRQSTDAHIAAGRAELSTRERALDERERQLNERELALNKILLTCESAERKAEEEEAVKQVEDGLEEVLLKNTKPERAPAALMSPSPARGNTRSNHHVPPVNFAGNSGSRSLSRPMPHRAAPTGSPAPFATHTALSPRSSAAPPLLPCSSPPPALPVGSPNVASSPLPRPSPSEGKMGTARPRSMSRGSMIAQQQEKLLSLLGTGGFQATAAADCDSTMNASIISMVSSTPGQNPTKQTRRSLAELLQEDEARLAKLRPN